MTQQSHLKIDKPMPDTQEVTAAVYAKTELGQQEIQTRSMGLSPLVRRLLVLVDGKRSAAEMIAFLPEGQDVATMLEALLAQGCIELRGKPNAAGDVPQGVTVDDADEAMFKPPVDANIPGLPLAASRSAKENEMARNFMINSINSIIGQQMRITLVNDIFHAETTEALRAVYHAWAASMSDHGVGKKRLPELRDKLFKVL